MYNVVPFTGQKFCEVITNTKYWCWIIICWIRKFFLWMCMKNKNLRTWRIMCDFHIFIKKLWRSEYFFCKTRNACNSIKLLTEIIIIKILPVIDITCNCISSYYICAFFTFCFTTCGFIWFHRNIIFLILVIIFFIIILTCYIYNLCYCINITVIWYTRFALPCIYSVIFTCRINII